MKKGLIAGVLSLVSGISSAATIVTLDGNALFTTSPVVDFDTSQNIFRVQSNQSLNCSGGTGVTPNLSILTVQVDNNPTIELQGTINIERVGGDTLVQVTTIGADVVCSFIDEILVDGFEEPVARRAPRSFGRGG